MHSKLIKEETGERVFVLVFDSGDEVMAGLQEFVISANVVAAHFTAIGAFSDALLGFFDPERKQYQKTYVREQVEVLSCSAMWPFIKTGRKFIRMSSSANMMRQPWGAIYWRPMSGLLWR
jgi:hypothetical protein